MRHPVRGAFTLVEILIVVVMLGILAALVMPSFTNATEQSKASTTFSELQKIRRHVEVYRARNSNRLPTVAEDDGTWGQIVGPEYLMSPPTNSWVGGVNSRKIHFGAGPDAAFQTDYGWIYDTETGMVWAGGFDADDHPLPRE